MISIIIPVYKVEEYLDQCIQSVVDQTYQDLEIILVDDGSPDNCPQMCEDWAKKDARIKVIHQENRGLSGARNTGIREAKGDWLYFLDSDDWIIPECIQLMVYCIDKYPEVQMVCAGAVATKSGYEWMSIKVRDLPDYSDNQDWINASLLKRNVFLMTAWNKLLKREFILEYDIFFKEGVLNEDEMWNFVLSKYLSSVAVCKEDTYYYNIRENSIISDKEKLSRNWLNVLNFWVDNIGGKYEKTEVIGTFNMIRIGLCQCMCPGQEKDYKNVIWRFVRKSRNRQFLYLLLYFYLPQSIKDRYNLSNKLISYIGCL